MFQIFKKKKFHLKEPMNQLGLNTMGDPNDLKVRMARSIQPNAK